MQMTSDDGKWKYGFIGFGVIMVTGIGLIIYNNTKTKRTRKRKQKNRIKSKKNNIKAINEQVRDFA